MSYKLFCLNTNCLVKQSYAENIVELIKIFVGKDYLFVCPSCSYNMYIEKHFHLQEDGETWNPFLRGIVPLGNQNDTYQPFIYLVSDEPQNIISSYWFCYYKDTRKQGGKLKLGYGPGGPPVLSIGQLKKLINIIEANP
ncbi:MAG: hypothetical protein PHV30_11995 [Candidatus Margulisbacteria bacterium]|nr:hypothetical protein [Candidatus Margulisiibacteriota bacterium]